MTGTQTGTNTSTHTDTHAHDCFDQHSECEDEVLISGVISEGVTECVLHRDMQTHLNRTQTKAVEDTA